ncbi:insulinase family protein [Myxococcota bacterium]|nr:insulinase family protein [Myxococcota bacterium]
MSDPAEVTRHTLQNGVQVWISENHEEPRVAARVAVRAGAAFDPPGFGGVAHALEHMLSNKGSRRLGVLDPVAEAPHLDRARALARERALGDPAERERLTARLREEERAAARYAVPNELKRALAAVGARGVNALTSHDLTAYVADLPSRALPVWAAIEADRLTGPSFRAMSTELDAITEEKLRAMDNADRCLAQATSEALFQDHPYGRDVLGSVEDVLRLHAEPIEAFHTRWYRPPHLAVLLAGDVDVEPTIRLLERSIGALDLGPSDPRPEPDAPAALPPLTERELPHHGDPELRIAWRGVPWGHPDHEALLLADMALNNRGGGLLDRLVQRQALRAAGSSPSFRAFGGAFLVWARPRPDQDPEALTRLLLEPIEALCNGDFTEDDLAAAALNFELGERARLERNDAQVQAMSTAFLAGRGWDFASAWLTRLRQLTKADVVAAAQRVFSGPQVRVRRVSGAPARATITLTKGEPTAGGEGHSPLFTELAALPLVDAPLQVLVEGEHYRRAEVASGVHYAVPSPYKNGLSRLTLNLERGAGHDPAFGLALRLWERSGVGSMRLEDVEDALYRRGVSFGLDTGRWATKLTLAGPEEAVPWALELIRARLLSPTLDDAAHRQVIEDVITRRRERRETKERRVEALRSAAFWGVETCPERTERLSDEALRSLTRQELLSKPKILDEERHLCFSTGPYDLPRLAELLTPEGRTWRSPSPVPPARYQRPDGVRVLWMHHTSAQATVEVLSPHGPSAPGADPRSGVLAELLGGSAGLIFQEVREARALAYSARGGYSLGGRPVDDNLLWASAATQAARAAEVAGLLLGLLRDRPIDPERFERAREAAREALRGHRVTYRGVAPAVEAWRVRGITADPRPTLLADLESLSLDTFADWWQKLRRGAFTVIVCGDRDQLDLTGLAQLGELVELDPDVQLAC